MSEIITTGQDTSLQLIVIFNKLSSPDKSFWSIENAAEIADALNFDYTDQFKAVFQSFLEEGIIENAKVATHLPIIAEGFFLKKGLQYKKISYLDPTIRKLIPNSELNKPNIGSPFFNLIIKAFPKMRFKK